MALGQGLFHDLQPAFKVVFHRAGHGLMQGQRTAEGFLPLVHALQIALGALLADAAFDRFTFDCTSTDCQREQARDEQLLTSLHP
ncbi:hypothetical protein D9M71_606170 [compost metagenome]